MTPHEVRRRRQHEITKTPLSALTQPVVTKSAPSWRGHCCGRMEPHLSVASPAGHDRYRMAPRVVVEK
jgi:hypothetical protein